MADATAHQLADRALGSGDLATARRELDRTLASDPADFDGWMKLATILRLSGDSVATIDAIDRALALRPLHFLPLLFKATVLERAADQDRAAELYRAALFQAGTEAQSPAVTKQLCAARAFLERNDRRIEERVAATLPDDLSPAAQRRGRGFVDNVLRRRPIYHQEPTHFRFPGLADIEFFDDHHAAVRARVESAAPAILAEFKAALALRSAALAPYVDFKPGQPVGQWATLNRSPNWNALHLVRHGELVRENADLCPTTMACFAEADQPDVARLAPNIMFSLLAPHTHIPPHTGVANFRSVLHLPLIVPPGCRFRVGSETRDWEVGKAWVFDDTIEHEAWNDSDALRVILIADLWRAELSQDDRTVVRAVMAALSTDHAIGAL